MVIGQRLDASGINVVRDAIDGLCPATGSDEKRGEKKKRRLEVRPASGLAAKAEEMAERGDKDVHSSLKNP